MAVYATLEDREHETAEMVRCGVFSMTEAEQEEVAFERALDQHLENLGYDEARAQEEYETSLGIDWE
jgi:hypothetical protein